jgi:hypothetical protein
MGDLPDDFCRDCGVHHPELEDCDAYALMPVDPRWKPKPKPAPPVAALVEPWAGERGGPIPRGYAVVKKRRTDGMVMMIFGFFRDRDAAYAYCANANEWYGEGHPLTPLEVIGDILIEPRLFPVESLRRASRR